MNWYTKKSLFSLCTPWKHIVVGSNSIPGSILHILSFVTLNYVRRWSWISSLNCSYTGLNSLRECSLRHSSLCSNKVAFYCFEESGRSCFWLESCSYSSGLDLATIEIYFSIFLLGFSSILFVINLSEGKLAACDSCTFSFINLSLGLNFSYNQESIELVFDSF